ncbi:unnamed protein product [Orchesella dallaii]|uniref:Tetratricopeptide repeat protein 27 n=1 Tax=Orchesella dallaii TaxID=48710 RepID=A0ABP1RV28_9HEXA
MFSFNENVELTVYNDVELEEACHQHQNDQSQNNQADDNKKGLLLGDLLPILPTITIVPCCTSDNDKDANSDSCEYNKNCSRDFKVFQRRLLLGEPPGKGKEENQDGFGEWENALKDAVRIVRRKFQKEEEMQEGNSEEDWLRIATLLRIFVQLNFTGPSQLTNKKVQAEVDALTTLSEDDSVEEIIKNSLELEGIELDPNTRLPILLVVVRHLLDLIQSSSSSRASWPFYLHWRVRTEFLHQKMLQRRCVQLSRNLKVYTSAYLSWRKLGHHNVLREVDASFILEIAEMLTYYYDGLVAIRFLEEARKVLGLKVNFSGRMGFRTKFQQTPMAQTIVSVDVAKENGEDPEEITSFPGFEQDLKEHLPKPLALNDETRLERVRLADSEPVQEEQGARGGIHQLVILGMMNHKVAFEKQEDLTLQEVQALVNVVLDNPVSWNGRVSALIARCTQEKGDLRAVDRSLRQLEDLLRTIWAKEDVSDEVSLWKKLSLRNYLFFGSGIPSRTELKLVFGSVLESINHWKEALRIYEEIGNWEKIIHCYKMLQLRHKAEALIRAKIEENGETPKLLVLLGDATSDLTYYEKAWELSGEKSYDSRIRVADHYFYRQEYEQAKPYLKSAISLSPLDYPCCLKLGWACYKTEDFSLAFQSYLKAANLEYDNYQVWSNLATCAVKLGRKEFALRAYKLAVKCNYDEWRLWTNLLVVAVELGELTQGIQAYHRILELKKDWGDNEVLRLMVGKVIEGGGGGSNEVKSKMAELMGRITAQNARGPFPWLLYGRLLASYLDSETETQNDKEIDVNLKMTNLERSFSYYNKALVLLRQNPRWKTEVGMMTNVVACIIEFRHQRCREEIPKELITPSHTSFDSSLKETAKSVYATVSSLQKANPGDSDLKELEEEMREELKEPFYASE